MGSVKFLNVWSRRIDKASRLVLGYMFHVGVQVFDLAFLMACMTEVQTIAESYVEGWIVVRVRGKRTPGAPLAASFA